MNKLSRNNSGRAFEYGIAVSFSEYLPAPIQETPQIKKAKECFELSNEKEQKKIVKAASEVAAFLVAHDRRLTEKGCTISLQSDQMGQQGDVRDIIIRNSKLNKEIGISAKNRHFAIKHPRLSEQGDFGFDWFGIHCSAQYFQQITPIFRELNSRKKRGETWNEIPDKKQRFYMPILQAFIAEMDRLKTAQPVKVARGLVQYLIGKFDYYKITKENGNVSMTSFNTNGTLGWGSKLPLPTRIAEIALKLKSYTTIEIIFDQGWHISFRIHSAKTLVEPSLKFDVNIIGLPRVMSSHTIPFG